MTDPLHTLKEAETLLGLRPGVLRRQVHLGRLAATRHGRDWLVRRSEIERYRREHRRLRRSETPTE
jgi:excisionase family DNA binding protein